MSTENGSLASSVIDFSTHTPSAARAHHRVEDEAHARAARIGAARRRATPRSANDALPNVRPPADDALPLNEFMRDLHREKRRAERSKAPLSLILYRIEQKGADGHCDSDQLLELLHDAKRETDILGHVGDDTIAVLCPDTDAEGTVGFMRKIEDQSQALPYSCVAATYPDHLFDNLSSGSHSKPELHVLLATDTPIVGRSTYPLKRYLDVLGATVALLVFAPIMLMVALAIALTSPGPIIFRQTRLGKGGVLFVFFKFRSMVTNVDDGIHRAFVANLINGDSAVDVPAEEEGKRVYKIRSDPRVTGIGKFIRKTSIDELPQLFNVLKGEMSLVGPRPPIPYEAENYQPWHLRRILAAKPGLTGLWQVEGRSRVSFNDMVRMDLRYIRDSSLSLDIKILLKTVLVVLRCDGAN